MDCVLHYRILAGWVVLMLLFGGTSRAEGCEEGSGLEGGERHLLQAPNMDCEVFEGREFSAALNLIDGNNIIVEDAAECCSLCKTTPGCKIWTYFDAPFGGAVANSCWLKAADSTTSTCEVCTSGIAPDKPKIAPRSASGGCVTMEGLNFFQGALHSLGGIVTKDLKECCDLCILQPECKAWTRTYNGECFLKGAVNAPSICQHCEASGLIDERPTAEELGNVIKFLEVVTGSAADDAAIFLEKVKQMLAGY